MRFSFFICKVEDDKTEKHKEVVPVEMHFSSSLELRGSRMGGTVPQRGCVFPSAARKI